MRVKQNEFSEEANWMEIEDFQTAGEPGGVYNILRSQLRFLALSTLKISPFLHSLYICLCVCMSTVMLGHLHVSLLNTPSR